MEEDEGIGNVPPGYQFRPHPEELVKFYLWPRLLNQPLPCQVIKELNLYDFHPRDILGNTPAGKHLYFFTPRKMEYPEGTRPARGTNGGYWKACGKDKSIRDKEGKEIGVKKFLVFHEGHQCDGTRTSWLMQEYTIREFWFPTDRNKNELGAMALCEIYLKPTPQEEVEEEGSASHSLDNIFADRLVRPRPPSCNHGNNRGKAPVDASTSGRPLAIPPITARPGPSMPFMGSSNHRRHNMVLIPRCCLRPGGPRAMGYSSSRQIRPFPIHHQPGHVARSSGFGNGGGLLQFGPSYLPMGYSSSHQIRPFLVHRQLGHVACSSGFGNDGGLLQPGASYLPNGNTVHMMSSCCACVVSAPSSQFGSSAISSFRNQLMPPHGEMSSPEFGVTAASSSQHQLPPQRMPPPQFDFEARQPMPSDPETSPQTT